LFAAPGAGGGAVGLVDLDQLGGELADSSSSIGAA